VGSESRGAERLSKSERGFLNLSSHEERDRCMNNLPSWCFEQEEWGTSA
jgi:hypothetical protein